MKKLIFFLLYFSEGAPIGFIWWAMPAILEEHGIDVSQIATIAAIATIPWSLKFLLAPFVDLISMYYLKLKKQLFIYQILMGVGIYFIPMALRENNMSFLIMTIAFHGLFAALQDICIDALAIRSIPEDETGKINGIMQSGMLIGRSIFGGAGVFIAHKFGLDILVYFLISSIWITLIMLQRTKFTGSEIVPVKVNKYLKDFWQLIQNKKFWILIGVTYFAGFSYNGISTIGGALLSKFGATPLEYGITYSLFLPITMAIGALVGGYFSDKKSSITTLRFNLAFSIMASMGVGLLLDNFLGIWFLICSYIIFYFFIGSTTSSLYGLLMQNTSKEFAALEYSIFMGVVNLCDSSTTYLVAQFVAHNTYFISTAYIGMICAFCYLFLHLFKRSNLSNVNNFS